MTTEEIKVGDYFLDDHDNTILQVIGAWSLSTGLVSVRMVGSKFGWAHNRDIILSFKKLTEQEALLHLLKHPQ